jgi:hypothetical protein
LPSDKKPLKRGGPIIFGGQTEDARRENGGAGKGFGIAANRLSSPFAAQTELGETEVKMKLWIKLIVGEKVKKSLVRGTRDDFDGLTEDLREICNELDFPTPMLLRSRYEQLVNFNMLKLKPDDFIESVWADCMYIESCAEIEKGAAQ